MNEQRREVHTLASNVVHNGRMGTASTYHIALSTNGQVIALSRQKYGFESRWGYYNYQVLKSYYDAQTSQMYFGRNEKKTKDRKESERDLNDINRANPSILIVI